MAKDDDKPIYKDLSYKIVGLLIVVHKELGPYCREKQYSDLFEKKLKENIISYRREAKIGDSGNILDFIIDDKIDIEFKTVPFLIQEHYNQLKRYLYQIKHKLGIIVNFRDKRIIPKRVLNINGL